MAQGRDLFKELGIEPSAKGGMVEPRDLFKELGITPSKTQRLPEQMEFKANRYPEFQSMLRQAGAEAQPGAVQGGLNSLINMANLIPKVNIPKFNFAPQTQVAKQSEPIGEIASFFAPGGIFKAIPGVKGGLNALKESSPFVNAILRNIGAASEGAIFGAANAPEGMKGEEGERGAKLGSSVNLATQLMTSRNPLLNALFRMGAGGAAGYFGAKQTGQNPYAGIATGATAGLVAPKTVNKLSELVGLSQPGVETLEHLSEAEARPAIEAGKKIGRPLTPGETTGNPDITAIEAQFGRKGEAAAERTRIAKENIGKEKAAITDLLDSIVDRSTPQIAKANADKVENLYKQSAQWNLSGQEVAALKQDPVIEQAFSAVAKEPAYKRKLAGVAEENFAYLNQVKRALDDMQSSALKAGDKVKAAEYDDARKGLLSIMDTKAPVYAQARAEAQKSIIRGNLQKAMRKKELTGTNFYNTVLKNEEEFDKLVDSLKNVPEAQDKLRNMRLSWKTLLNLANPKSSFHQAESGISQSREPAAFLMDAWNSMTGSRRNVEALRFIHSGEWDKKFQEIREIKDAQKRSDALINLLGKVTASELIK